MTENHQWRDLAVPIGLGGNTFGRTSDETASERVLDAFVDAGGTFIDTADTYSGGESEAIIGRWMQRRGNRDRVQIATKVGNQPPYDDLMKASITAAVDESLRRLQTDYIDVYFAHYEDKQTPIEQSAEAFDDLVRAGKIRSYGLSNFEAETVGAWFSATDALGCAAPRSLQPHYSLVHREPYESGLAPLAREHNLAVVPYRSLGGGFLSGKYRTEADTLDRPRGPGVRPMLTTEGLALLDAVRHIADAHDVAPATIALAWLLHQPMITAPLASASDPAQLAEIMAAPTVSLTDDDLAVLDSASRRLGTSPPTN